MQKTGYDVDYNRWGKLVVRVQLIIALCVFVVEVINNILLYVTRSQGYGPDTIFMKLLRYLVLTSIINFSLVLMSRIVEIKEKDEGRKRILLMTFTTLMCTDVAFSHYQFAVTMAIFSIPLVVSIIYEERILLNYTFGISVLGQSIAVVARALDSDYNKDIGPEAAIALSEIITVFVFSRIIINTLEKRRTELKAAIIEAEKANADSDKIKYSMTMLETLAGTLDAKDRYTNGHSLRVALYSTKLARAYGMDENKTEILRYEAMLHDIGKIGVPDSILNKPSRLSDMEFALIKSHTVIGSDILKNMIAVPGASDVARHHHERYDGRGYPDSLYGDNISLNARIVCIADAFDAMNSDRIYRDALAPSVIRQELEKGRGTQFDPELLDIFLELFDNDSLHITDALTVTEDVQQKRVMSDIREMLRNFRGNCNVSNSLYDFNKFYKYMRNIGLRYERTVEVLQIDIERKADSGELSEDSTVSDIVQIAIRRNIRAVDVYYRHSMLQHYIILLDAGRDNIEVIKKRILFDYEASEISHYYRLKFTLNDSDELSE